MDMSEMMSKMMDNKGNQKMPPVEMMQMCMKMKGENIKPGEMCKKIKNSLDELIEINREILQELKKIDS